MAFGVKGAPREKSVSGVGTGHQRLTAPPCQGAEQEGHSSRDRDPQASVEPKRLEPQAAPVAACQPSAKPALFHRARSGRRSPQRYFSASTHPSVGLRTVQRQRSEERGLWGHQEGFVLCPRGPTFREGVGKKTFF